MLIKQKTLCILRVIVSVCMTAIVLFSCASKAEYLGKYTAYKDKLNGAEEQIIELREKDQGVWRTEDEEVSFTWNVKKDEIRLHLKLGGVIIGKIKNDKIEIKLPGSKIMIFNKDRHLI